MQEESESPKRTVDVYPLSKGRRILCALADIFLALILSLIFFHFAVYPLGQIIIGQSERNEEFVAAKQARDDILFGNELLFSKATGEEKYNTQSSIEYTFVCYLSYWANNGDAKNEVFHHYYVDLRNDQNAYVSFYKDHDKPETYFFFQGNTVSLKQEYVDGFKPYFDEKDQMTSAMTKSFEALRDGVYAKMYGAMLKDIEEKDLSYQGKSYIAQQSKIAELNRMQDLLVVISCFIALLLAIIPLYLLPPFFNQGHKTLSMLFLRYQTVDKIRFRVWKIKHILMGLPFEIAKCAVVLFFLPLPLFAFSDLFSLPLLLPISLISLAYFIGSLVFVLLDNYNRYPSDFFIGTVMITDKTLGEIYRSKGYKV